MQITTLLCCALLVGFVTAAKKTNPKEMYIDDYDGSGVDEDLKSELEASGSGHGPDDDDDDNHRPDNKNDDLVTPPPPPTTTTEKEATTKKSRDDFHFVTETNHSQTHKNDDHLTHPNSKIKLTSFFAQPGILAAAIGGAIVGLLCAILVVMFIVYRMRKKDEGTYTLEETKRLPTSRK